MKINSFILMVWILYILVLTGCASVNPLVTDYENHFYSVEPSQQDLIKSSPIKQTFYRSYDEVWDSVLYILAQHAIIIDLSKESGRITYLSIDSLSFANVFPEDQFYYWEFPFTVLIANDNHGITVFVYPMSDIYSDKNKKKKWWKVIDAGFKQNANDFIDKLSTQLSVKERWQWLRGAPY